MSLWNRNYFGNVQKNLAEAKSKLKSIQELETELVSKELLDGARREVNIWLEREEVMWRQWSRVLWLREGDQKSKFFHPWATNCLKKNRLDTLKDGIGRRLSNRQLQDHIVGYFQNLFSVR